MHHHAKHTPGCVDDSPGTSGHQLGRTLNGTKINYNLSAHDASEQNI
ncbi:hypothetical protein BH11ARM1_BH11ARM1_12310 [soil metagenome]